MAPIYTVGLCGGAQPGLAFEQDQFDLMQPFYFADAHTYISEAKFGTGNAFGFGWLGNFT